jgi:prephenate dehydratase
MPAPRVAFQGEPGAFGELAIVRRWRSEAQPVAVPTFGAVLDQVVDGTSDFAVLPVWNSTIGDVHDAHAALRAQEHRVEVCDEVVTPVRHALLARPGASLDTVRWAGSHPAALGQCSRFFARHPAIAAIPAYDTAGAARELDRFGARDVPNAATTSRPWYADLPVAAPDALGVVASATVACRYGLVVLDDGIQDDPENATRFAVLRRRETGRW